jgi:transposase
MKNIPLGIDVSKAKFDAALITSEGTLHKVFKNQPKGFFALMRWLTDNGVNEVHACLEATGSYSEALATFLYDINQTVSVVNPKRIKAYAASKLSRNKTDKADATLIATFCAEQTPYPWRPIEPATRKLQGLLRRLEALEHMKQQEANRLTEGINDSEVKDSLVAHIAYLEEQQAAILDTVKEHVGQNEALNRQRDLLITIPGIGELTAARLLAELPDMTKLSVRQVVAHAGLSPKQHLSGSSIKGRTRISKAGNAGLRKALYMPAVAAKRYNPIVRELCLRLEKRGKCKMSALGAAMRKLLHLAYGVLKTGKPFDPMYSG